MKIIEVHRRLIRAHVPQVLLGLTSSHEIPLCWIRRAPNDGLWLHALWLSRKEITGQGTMERLRPPPRRCGRLERGPVLTPAQWQIVTEVAEPVGIDWVP